jgi:glycosyltransferase involved in cell wall biosynthesis
MSEPVAPLAVGTKEEETEEPPDVSVLTPSFGYAQFIGDAIESVAGQDGVTVEHIVQDGGSDDGTIDVLRRNAHVRWRSEPDEGQSDALNRALRLARGRWVAWLNADEFYLPDGLRRLVELGERTDADLVYGDTVFVDGEGRLVRLLPQHRFAPFVLRSYGPFIGTVSMIVRRTRLGADPIDPTMKRMMDWDLFLRLTRDGARFSYAPEPVGAFRVHDERVTATERRGWFQRLNMGDGFGREYLLLRERYGALRLRRVGHLLHGAEKLAAGSYARQVRARRFRGEDLRWFASADALSSWRRMHEACYER